MNALKKEIPEGSTIQPINRLITSRSWPVKVSRGGLVTIPKELRVKHDIQAGDDIDLIIFNGWISLIPTKNRPRAYKKLLALATKVLEDNNRATHWLHRPQYGLGGKRPIDHMRTKKGAKEVEDLLGAIECGNYA